MQNALRRHRPRLRRRALGCGRTSSTYPRRSPRAAPLLGTQGVRLDQRHTTHTTHDTQRLPGAISRVASTRMRGGYLRNTTLGSGASDHTPRSQHRPARPKSDKSFVEACWMDEVVVATHGCPCRGSRSKSGARCRPSLPRCRMNWSQRIGTDSYHLRGVNDT